MQKLPEQLKEYDFQFSHEQYLLNLQYKSEKILITISFSENNICTQWKLKTCFNELANVKERGMWQMVCTSNEELFETLNVLLGKHSEKNKFSVTKDDSDNFLL